MPTPPPEPPESLIVGNFSGIRNTVSEERLQPGDLAAAVNVDIDDAGQLRRRRGVTRLNNANHHSLVDIAGRVLVVRDGVLGFLNDGSTFIPLTSVGPNRLAYTHVGADIYYASETTNGKIIGGIPATWGTAGGGQWISPVVTPTDTLGAISGRMLSAPPVATEIEHYKGRIYLGAGRVLWATELYAYDLVDKTRNYIYLPDEITMITSVDDGLYVGTTAQLLFLQGTFSEGLKQTIVLDAPVVRGSVVIVPASKSHPRARQGPVPESSNPMFMTGGGICLGLNGGEVYNLTQDRMVFPGVESAAAMYREDRGNNSYVAVTDSGGGAASNARIGDYVDAEVIRAVDRSGWAVLNDRVGFGDTAEAEII